MVGLWEHCLRIEVTPDASGKVTSYRYDAKNNLTLAVEKNVSTVVNLYACTTDNPVNGTPQVAKLPISTLRSALDHYAFPSA